MSAAMDAKPDSSCYDLAREHPEPYSQSYQNQHIDLDGPMYAYYNWKEEIDSSQIDIQKQITISSDCRLVIKVIDSDLYVYENSKCYDRLRFGEDPVLNDRYESAIDLMLLALEVYTIPDVDFVINLSDTEDFLDMPEYSLPMMSYSVRLEPPRDRDIKYYTSAASTEGFTYPSFGAYQHALGREQVRIMELS